MTNTTALQIINFNFYGDDLIALKDNATGEIYTSINAILRGIGFTERQTKHIHKKWNEDIVISKGVQNFVLPDKNGINQDTLCISDRKLPLALAKINITPSMKKKQSELTSRLELYQDKCADVLASVFIDNKSPNQIIMQPIIDTLNTLTQSLTTTLQSINTRLTKLEESQASQNKQPAIQNKRYSYWASKMFPKYQLLMEHFGITQYKELYKQLYWELQNTYPDVELNQIIDDYCYENHLDSCFTLDAIEHDKMVRKLFEGIVDGLLEKYSLTPDTKTVKYKTIFDE